MLKKVIVTGVMAAIISLSTTFANAGIIVFGKDASTATASSTTSDPCSDQSTSLSAGIIVFGATGIIVFGATDQPSACGIIVFG